MIRVSWSVSFFFQEDCEYHGSVHFAAIPVADSTRGLQGDKMQFLPGARDNATADKCFRSTI